MSDSFPNASRLVGNATPDVDLEVVGGSPNVITYGPEFLQSLLSELEPEEIKEIIATSTKLININTATVDLLVNLPHIGVKRAQRLIENRGEGYLDMADLRERSGLEPGLSDDQWLEIEPLITFGE